MGKNSRKSKKVRKIKMRNKKIKNKRRRKVK